MLWTISSVKRLADDATDVISPKNGGCRVESFPVTVPIGVSIISGDSAGQGLSEIAAGSKNTAMVCYELAQQARVIHLGWLGLLSLDHDQVSSRKPSNSKSSFAVVMALGTL